MQLRRDVAEHAIVANVGEALGMSAGEAAFGILRIVDNNMANAIRNVSVDARSSRLPACEENHNAHCPDVHIGGILADIHSRH